MSLRVILPVIACAALCIVAGAVAPPAALTYQVRPGDTLGAIAARCHMPVAELARLNRLADPNCIVAGQSLVIRSLPATCGFTAAPGRLQSGWLFATGPLTLTAQPAAGAARVDFYAVPAGKNRAPRLLGSAAGAAGGWTLAWEPPPHTAWHVWAVAVDRHATSTASALVHVYRE